MHLAGQSDAALTRAERHLAQSPRDATMRFQRALILADTGRTAQAIEAFTSLTQDHPDLPEPYNNLAALHAARGDYDAARNALEFAVRSQPGFAAAHENLGDVYVALARRAYARTAQLEPSNATVAPKLALLRQLTIPAPVAVAPSFPPSR
ncbi:MAG: tetratricopeptide repeat protein [Burkholderiaceae bacterium]